MLADALGRPLRLIIAPGQRGDITQVPALREGQSGDAAIADNAHDGNASRNLIASMTKGRRRCTTVEACLPDDAIRSTKLVPAINLAALSMDGRNYATWRCGTWDAGRLEKNTNLHA